MLSKRSCGYDDVSNMVLKGIILSIRGPLEYIFNLSLVNGIFPDSMKIAKIKSLHKGEALNDCDNYRPISLLPCISKILEKIVYKRLMSHMEDNDQIYCKQYGFRRNHSTVNAVQNFLGDALEGLENEMFTLAVFIDLKKAFDTVDHEIIIEKLHCLGLSEITLKWFESYLTNRQQYTNVMDANSTMTQVEVGVSQGSLLGVLLFLIEINDLRHSLKHTSSILYADDTMIYVIGKNLRMLQLKMQQDLEYLSMWLRSNKLLLNVKKTKFMLFS